MKLFKEEVFNISNYIEEHNKVLSKIDVDSLQAAIDMVVDAFQRGVKIITCGNGGSASTASHYITDWVKMANLATGEKFRGFSLVDNIGLVTAYGNDLSYDDIFSGQCTALLDKGDLLVVVSGSGNSTNIVNAVNEANKIGADTLAILGYDGGEVIKIAGKTFLVPSFDMQVCEDIHLMFGHLVMKALCDDNIKGVI
tara:strand:- start:1157 stop:1747 length:591 start_codon:yes stop_codon:yes gene_type:complete